MPFQLDDYDVSILKALIKDGRKSLREIPRETGITTPTVKSRFERLINVGFIKSVSHIFDFEIVEENIVKPELQEDNNRNSMAVESAERSKKNRQYNLQHQQQQLQDVRFRIKKEMKIKLICEFCKGPTAGNPHVFSFANYERFFCCTTFMSGYKQ
jgi:DNA-binding Lrp family transcriptional regulator